MSVDSLFPQPKSIAFGTELVDLGSKRPVVITDSTEPLIKQGYHLLTSSWPAFDHTSGQTEINYPVEIRLDPRPNGLPEEGVGQGYVLTVGREGVTLVGQTEAGLYHGCQTLRTIVSAGTDPVREMTIHDWPDFTYRGLYIESKWGSDLMTLDDWKAAIDHMARLKFNALGIGIYGCWIVQYGGKRTEFLMVPFADHPELQTPKTLRYYSPTAVAWQVLEYLPTMVTEDSFGEIVAYGKANNITVRPHFNSPGHNTVIPRVFPEISAKDESGKPIGYGFCLSDPKTYSVLFELYDSVIDRYLLPNGIDWFHMGMDEVEAYKGISEDDPSIAIDPWCRCPECRHKPHALQLQEYAIRVCLHLKERGITNITMWNDALDKLDALNEDFAAMVTDAGLQGNLIVQYWRYHEPVLVPPRDLGLRTWSTPMAGYWPNMFTQSYTANISRMLLHGYRAGAEGADAYCLYDPAFDRNYTCLAEYGWNQTTSEDLYQFKSRYARALLSPMLEAHLAVEAFNQYDQVFDATPWTETYLASLLYYWHTYPASRQTGAYPQDVLLEIRSSHMRSATGFQRAAESAKSAASLFAEAQLTSSDPLIEQYWVECDKMVGVWESFATALAALGSYERAEASSAPPERTEFLAEAAERVIKARDRFAQVMTEIERVKSSFLLPQLLRDLSAAYLYFDRLSQELAQLANQASTGSPVSLPPFMELNTNREQLDPFLSSNTTPPQVAAARGAAV
jgi:hypothetical protein